MIRLFTDLIGRKNSRTKPLSKKDCLNRTLLLKKVGSQHWPHPEAVSVAKETFLGSLRPAPCSKCGCLFRYWELFQTALSCCIVERHPRKVCFSAEGLEKVLTSEGNQTQAWIPAELSRRPKTGSAVKRVAKESCDVIKSADSSLFLRDTLESLTQHARMQGEVVPLPTKNSPPVHTPDAHPSEVLRPSLLPTHERKQQERPQALGVPAILIGDPDGTPSSQLF